MIIIIISSFLNHLKRGYIIFWEKTNLCFDNESNIHMDFEKHEDHDYNPNLDSLMSHTNHVLKIIKEIG